MLNRDDDPDVVYSDAFMRHLTQIWNVRISYPNEELYLFDDDVKGAFRRSKYHPDVAGARVSPSLLPLQIPVTRASSINYEHPITCSSMTLSSLSLLLS